MIAIYFYEGGDAVIRTQKRLNAQGVSMQKNEWREFNLDNIPGETPASLFGGMTKAEAILKYKLELMYPFDGKVGFYGGSDREDIGDNHCRESKDIYCEEKLETAYLFRSTDDGKSFTRYKLEHGIVNGIKKSEGRYFLNVYEEDTKRDKTYISDDFGERWRKLGDIKIEALWSKERFIYSVSKAVPNEVQVNKKVSEYFYTKDGGKTSQPLPQKIVAYAKEASMQFYIYQGKLVFLVEGKLKFVDIDTLEEEEMALEVPKGKKIVGNVYVDKENRDIYFILQEQSITYGQSYQPSVWYPLSNEHVQLTKSPPNEDGILYFDIAGNYIGGMTRVKGYLLHMWTMNKGKKWHYEMLPKYLFDTAYTGYGNNRIWMEALVLGERGKRGTSMFVMGKIKEQE
jgi:hypothetical protein